MVENRKLGNFEVYNSNPFEVVGVKMVSKISRGKTLGIVEDEEGDIYEKKEIDNTIFYQRDFLSYTKVFHEYASKVKDLTSPAIKLWIFILINLKKNNNIIELNIKDIKDFTGYSSHTNIYLAICELLEKKVIARKTRKLNNNVQEFFVNPNMFYNGDRTKLIEALKK